MFQIVRLICSFVDSTTTELGRLRLVNHLFYQEATKILRLRPVLIKSKSQVDGLLYITKIHKNLELTPFPFASFNLILEFNGPQKLIDLESIESFVNEIGPHIRRLAFQAIQYKAEDISVIGDTLVALLCHTPELREIEIRRAAAFNFSAQQLLRIPLRFPNLRVIDINNNVAGSFIESILSNGIIIAFFTYFF